MGCTPTVTGMSPSITPAATKVASATSASTRARLRSPRATPSRPDLAMAAVAGGINAAEARVRAAVPLVSLMYLEPDLYRADLAKPV